MYLGYMKVNNMKFWKDLEKKEKIILILVTIISLFIRFLWFNGKTGDYLGFLKVWVENIRELGYFKALKYNLGNYNVPYMIILTLISFIKGEPLYSIKIVSVIFDFICAIYGVKIVHKLSKNKISSIITYCVLMFLPTMIVNGAMWGQCDSIFTAFTLMSLYYLIEQKYIKSFILLGVSFAFKLQCVFILPLYVLLLFRDKKIHIYHFFIIPLMNMLLCLPAVIAGRPFVETMLIYLDQSQTYSDLVLNFPNLYNLIQSNEMFYINNYEIVSKVGIIVTLFMFFCIWMYTLLKKVKFNNEKIITVSIWSIVICTYFLPHMHDRYMFVADLLSVIWFIIYQKKFHIPVVINIISFLTYFKFLFRLEFINYNLLSIIYFIVIVEFTIYVIKLLGDCNESKRNKMERKKLRKVC